MPPSSSYEAAVSVELSDGHDPEQFWASFLRIVNDSRLCALSTVDHSGSPHINTVFVSYEKLKLFFISDVRSQHSRNLVRSSRIALALWPEGQNWGANIRGAQLSGNCTLVHAEDRERVRSVYSSRFPQYAAYVGSREYVPDLSFRFHAVKIRKITLIDEEAFGDENFVTGEIHNDECK